jgi:hypothetical protein
MMRELLREKKTSILRRWVQSVAETYPAETSTFLISQKNRFNNPVGYAISTSAEEIFDALVEGERNNSLGSPLKDLMKIRAVQDFTPSQAAGFIFVLKRMMIDELRNYIDNETALREFMDIESTIDAFALAAFEWYVQAREEIYRIRVKELKRNLA